MAHCVGLLNSEPVVSLRRTTGRQEVRVVVKVQLGREFPRASVESQSSKVFMCHISKES
jgi:hypothetical protein